MPFLTNKEKISIAEKEVLQAEQIIEITKKDLASWLNKLTIRQEYLEVLKKQKS